MSLDTISAKDVDKFIGIKNVIIIDIIAIAVLAFIIKPLPSLVKVFLH